MADVDSILMLSRLAASCGVITNDENVAGSAYARLSIVTDLTDALNRKAGTKGKDLPEVLARLTGTTVNDLPVMLRRLTTATPNGWLNPGTLNTDVANTPDYAALNVAGTLQITARVKGISYTPAGTQMIVGHWDIVSNQRSWGFFIPATTGTLLFQASSNGTAVAVTQASSAAGLVNNTEYWLGVEYVTTTGACTFYKAPAGINEPTKWTGWTQISTHAPAACVLFDATCPASVGAFGSFFSANFPGIVYIARAYQTGTRVLDFDASPSGNAIPGTSTFTDSLGKVWTVRGGSSIASA